MHWRGPTATWCLVAALSPARAAVGVQDSTGQMPSAKCGAPEYRRLDVWIGDQDVVNRGRHAGVNLFTREEDGPLHGRWRGDRGSPGRSLPFRDRKTIRDGRYRRRGT